MSVLRKLLASSIRVEHVLVDAAGVILEANKAFAAHVSTLDVRGTPLDLYMTSCSVQQLRERYDAAEPTQPLLINFRACTGGRYTLRCVYEVTGEKLEIVGERDSAEIDDAIEQVAGIDQELAVLAREHARRGKELELANRKLADALAELEQTHWHLKRVQEFMPHCMTCGKLKTDDHDWKSVSEYFAENRIFLSHGFCPACSAAALRDQEG